MNLRNPIGKSRVHQLSLAFVSGLLSVALLGGCGLGPDINKSYAKAGANYKGKTIQLGNVSFLADVIAVEITEIVGRNRVVQSGGDLILVATGIIGLSEDSTVAKTELPKQFSEIKVLDAKTGEIVYSQVFIFLNKKFVNLDSVRPVLKEMSKKLSLK